MAKFFSEADVKPQVIRERQIAILGYGSQGRSHALNLRDTGLDVTVGLYEGSPSWAKAEADGLQVQTVERATQNNGVLMFCLPDVKMARIYEAHVLPHLGAGQALPF